MLGNSHVTPLLWLSDWNYQAMEEAKVTEVEIDEVRRRGQNFRISMNPSAGTHGFVLCLILFGQVLQGLRAPACLETYSAWMCLQLLGRLSVLSCSSLQSAR